MAPAVLEGDTIVFRSLANPRPVVCGETRMIDLVALCDEAEAWELNAADYSGNVAAELLRASGVRLG
jgi:hypothetical protein